MGEERQSNEVFAVNLDLLEENGVKYEKIEEFNSSLFQNVYYDAFVNTWRLIEHGRKYKDSGTWEHDRFYNIIPFWGPRGMGKTSVMRSYLGELDRLDAKKYRVYYEEAHIRNRQELLPSPEDQEKCEFIFLECIDASLLGEDEDIFEVILAKMLGAFLDKVSTFPNNKEWEVNGEKGYYKFRKAEVITKFGELHNYLANMRKTGNRHEVGTGAVEILKDLSGSLDLREKFKELVPLYLRVMSRKNDNKTTEYRLVISIDDIDMKMSGYNMLEQLHRYFMIPDVLIYITVAESELYATCYNHFAAKAGADVSEGERKKKLTWSYIDKVLPFSKRIYMPTLASLNRDIRVKPDEKDAPCEDIKKTVLCKLAKATGVYYDGCGMKRHFYEPDNIRSLVNLMSVIRKMKELNENSSFSQYLTNMSYLMEDITYRLAAGKLNGEQRDVFVSIADTNQERQGMAFLDMINQFLPNEDNDSVQESYEYNYGELLRGLNLLGKQRREYKSIVHCVLALETAQLTNLYECSRRTKDESKKDYYAERLKNTMSGSVGGRWANKLVPKMLNPMRSMQLPSGQPDRYSQKAEVSWGYMKGRINHEADAVLDPDNGPAGFLYQASVLAEHSKSDEKYNACIEMLEDEKLLFVRAVELLCMFLTELQTRKGEKIFRITNMSQAHIKQTTDVPVSKESDESEKEVEEEAEDTENKSEEELKKEAVQAGGFVNDSVGNSISVQINDCQAVFDILGFVINCMDGDKFFDKVDGQLYSALESFCGIADDERTQTLKDTIKRLSLKEECRKWREKYTYAALPVYSTDITYNVLKRAIRKRKAGDENQTGESALLESVREAYENIAENLDNEDEYYTDSSDGSCPNFAEIFRQCPVVKIIAEQNYGEQFEDVFARLVKKFKLTDEVAEAEDTMGSR